MPCPAQSDLTIIKDALKFAVDMGYHPEKYTFNGFRGGLAGYDNLIKTLTNNQVDPFGIAYNVAVWSESRENAVGFLQEAKNRLSGNYKSLFDKAIDQYKIVSDNLKKVTQLFPYEGVLSWQMENNIKDKTRKQKAIQYLQIARDEEKKGLKFFDDIIKMM